MPFLSQSDIDCYCRDGFLVLHNFWSEDQVERAKSTIAEVINEMNFDESSTIFTTGSKQSISDEYFLGSGDKVRFFWEEDAFDENGSFCQEKMLCINKIGHALHDLVPVFKDLSYDHRVGNICRELGMHKPLACQSMYIFKQPRIGGQVRPHQDGAFLYTEPQSVIGFWWALEQCTVENGCLWAVPGSHRLGVNRRLRRSKEPSGGCEFYPLEEPNWDISDAVKLEVEAGTLVVLHNAVVHYSLENKSNKSRHAYSVHVIDGAENIIYPSDNWLQKDGEFNTIEPGL